MNSKKLYKTDGYIAYMMLITSIAISPILKILGFIIDNYNMQKPVKYILFVCLVIFILLNIKSIFKFKRNKLYNMALFTFILIFIMYFISYPIVSNYSYIYIYGIENQIVSPQEYYFMFLKDTMFMYLIYWVIGSNINNLFDVLKGKKIKGFTIILYILFIILFLHIQVTQHTNLIDTIFESNDMYLFVGDTFAIFSLLVFGIYKNNLYKIIISINSIFWLYKIGSRTSFYIFCFVMFFMALRYFIKSSVNKKIIIILLSCIFIIVAAAYLVNVLISNGFLSADNRMMRGIIDISQDVSYQERLIQFEDGFNDIKQFWLTGRLFREVERLGTPGAYMHNILSYWVEFGVIPFFLLAFLSIYCFVKGFINYFSSKGNKLNNFIFSLSCYVFLLIFLSRSYVYPYIWLALAANCRTYSTYSYENISFNTAIKK